MRESLAAAHGVPVIRGWQRGDRREGAGAVAVKRYRQEAGYRGIVVAMDGVDIAL